MMEIKFDPQNTNKGTKRGRDMVKASLEEYGTGRSIVVDKNGVIIAGNKTFEQAQALGLPIEIIETQGDKLVIVKRIDLDTDDKRRKELALADNRSSEVGLDYDIDNLKLFADDIDLSKFFSDGELTKLYDDDLLAGLSNPDSKLEEIDALRNKFDIKDGQLWKLGEHRLICGDSRSAEIVEKLLDGQKPMLMVTDPPYGVNYDPNWRNEAAAKGLISYAARSIGKVQNDGIVDWSEAYKLIDAQIVYIWHAGQHAGEVQKNIIECGYRIVSQIIWGKPGHVISRGDYHGQHEPCWYAVKKGKNHNWQGSRKETTLWSAGRGIQAKSGHGTEKPLECMAKPIINNTSKVDIVCDPFLGSGTTLIACEQLERQGRFIEIDSGYVALAIQRWVDLTGKEPELLK